MLPINTYSIECLWFFSLSFALLFFPTSTLAKATKVKVDLNIRFQMTLFCYYWRVLNARSESSELFLRGEETWVLIWSFWLLSFLNTSFCIQLFLSLKSWCHFLHSGPKLSLFTGLNFYYSLNTTTELGGDSHYSAEYWCGNSLLTHRVCAHVYKLFTRKIQHLLLLPTIFILLNIMNNWKLTAVKFSVSTKAAGFLCDSPACIATASQLRDIVSPHRYKCYIWNNNFAKWRENSNRLPMTVYFPEWCERRVGASSHPLCPTQSSDWSTENQFPVGLHLVGTETITVLMRSTGWET